LRSIGKSHRDEVRRKILWDNRARLYNIDSPAAALTKGATRVSAARD